jgi:hypothetical protein
MCRGGRGERYLSMEGRRTTTENGEGVDPIDLSEHPPEAAEDRQLVFDLSEQVRDVIQHKLYENLVLRGSAFL